jgi:hypothetical protein
VALSVPDREQLDEALHDCYGADAELITSGNAIQLLQTLWSL